MTAQFHEGLILDGERTSMACCPDLPEDQTPGPIVGTENETAATETEVAEKEAARQSLGDTPALNRQLISG